MCKLLRNTNRNIKNDYCFLLNYFSVRKRYLYTCYFVKTLHTIHWQQWLFKKYSETELLSEVIRGQ